jgi:23S rRNA (pseudouridine1915-N3)-methyltransferase
MIAPPVVEYSTKYSRKSSAFSQGFEPGRRGERMEITLVCVGKIREKRIGALCEDYVGRIGHYGHKVRVLEVKDEPGGRPDQLVVERESERITEKIPAGAWTVALDLRGEMLSSGKFASRIDQWVGEGVRELCFIVGGHLGMSSTLLAACRQRLSLSRMTMTHEMARMVLLEQLYRANTIIRGEPYHK